ncbi:glutamine amidotransferase [Tumebacillus algifaecis]|uniref:Lipid II isoglutaminyl synthase (glutamine-hydrolyzing) subunit GatD n=1 Tax=Tumebacillus algifaecis TaxID=1214604 RepID=A0A223D3L3_9BACL|nr:glutamine amidotransferase [Tumebacillus algifaecis]ASS75986.1 glutamine amidotransferase [Tumebacillus algifaecis]
MHLKIAHLYPDLLDLYSDRGNVIILQKRVEWRGLRATVDEITVGHEPDLSEYDILVLGGGMDREQGIVAEDLQKRRENLQQAVEKGTVILAICGGYQLLGNYFETAGGQRIPGIGLLDIETVGAKVRMVGNVVAEMEIEGVKTNIIGYENHSGKTYLGKNVQPMMKVIKGYGNSGEDKFEGVRQGSVFGTYLHGPLLAKNPTLADYLITLALRRKDLSVRLDQLEDGLEARTQQKLYKRLVESR